MVVGLKKGHKVTKNPQKPRHSGRRGRLTKKTKFVRDLVREVCGFAAYERRCIELLRIGKDKRALRFSKKRLGSHVRAKKREEMQAAIQPKRNGSAEIISSLINAENIHNSLSNQLSTSRGPTLQRYAHAGNQMGTTPSASTLGNSKATCKR